MTEKKPTKKAAAKKTTAAKPVPEAMDPSVQEVPRPEVSSTRQRNAYALDTLVKEVTDLYPDTTHEVSGRDGRGTALTVQFALASDDAEVLIPLFHLAGHDDRVAETVIDAEDLLVTVTFWASARTQDSREPFGLGDALIGLTDVDGGDADSEDDSLLEGGGA